MPDITVRKSKKSGTVGVSTVTENAPAVVLKSTTPGPVGPEGPQGIQGVQGMQGFDAGVGFLFSTLTTDQDPQQGKFRFNNSTIASVTEIYISNEDAFGGDVSAWMQVWDDVVAPVRGYIIFRKNNTGEACVFSIVGEIEFIADSSGGNYLDMGYCKVPVSYIMGSLYANLDFVLTQFTPASGSTPSPFQTAVADSAGDYDIDATVYKDWVIDTVEGDCTINLNNTADGDAGMLEVIMDSTGGWTVTLGAMFTKQMGPMPLDNTAGADNIISWRKVGTSNIVYTIAQIEV